MQNVAFMAFFCLEKLNLKKYIHLWVVKKLKYKRFETETMIKKNHSHKNSANYLIYKYTQITNRIENYY